MDNKSVMKVKILAECGEEWAAEAVRLNKKQYGKDMTGVMNTLANAGGGHNKFLQMIQLWVDYTTTRGIHQQIDTYRIGVTKSSESTHHRLIEDVLNTCIDRQHIIDKFEENGVIFKKDFPINATASVIGRLRRDPGDGAAVREYLEKFCDPSADVPDMKVVELSTALLDSFKIDYRKYYDMFEGGEEAITKDTVDRMVDIALSIEDDRVTKLHQLKRMLPEGFLQRRIMCCSLQSLCTMIDQRADDPFVQWQEFCKQILLQIKHPEWLRAIMDRHHLVLEDLKRDMRNGRPYGVQHG